LNRVVEVSDPAEFANLEVPGRGPAVGANGALGIHYLADFSGCRTMPQQAEQLERLMISAGKEIQATIVSSSFHEFSPHGLSGVVVIAESHLAVHTWPEHRVACVDLFTCSAEMNAIPGLKFLFDRFGAGTMKLTQVARSPTPPPD